jgi:hypothetical protein
MGGSHVRFGEHRFEYRQNAVYVGHHSDGRDHQPSMEQTTRVAVVRGRT